MCLTGTLIRKGLQHALLVGLAPDGGDDFCEVRSAARFLGPVHSPDEQLEKEMTLLVGVTAQHSIDALNKVYGQVSQTVPPGIRVAATNELAQNLLSYQRVNKA